MGAVRKCPACSNLRMQMFRDPKSELEIDSCPECFGLWFDGEELKVFFESPDLSTRIIDEERFLPPSNLLESKARSGSRECPTCAEALFNSQLGRVQVDYCLSCRGIWLDRHELDALVRAYQAGERGNLLIVNQLTEGLGTPNRPNPKAREFLETLDRYRDTWHHESNTIQIE